jgi:DNA-binding NarL/FixJ family response regulator
MTTHSDETEVRAPVALVLTGNLFFIPRIESAAIRSGMEAVYGNSAAGLLKSTAGREVALALVDLETDEASWIEGVSVLASALKATRKTGEGSATSAPVIAYGPHGDAETLRKARSLGCDAVLTKRDFSQRLLELMGTRGQAVISP